MELKATGCRWEPVPAPHSAEPSVREGPGSAVHVHRSSGLDDTHIQSSGALSPPPHTSSCVTQGFPKPGVRSLGLPPHQPRSRDSGSIAPDIFTCCLGTAILPNVRRSLGNLGLSEAFKQHSAHIYQGRDEPLLPGFLPIYTQVHQLLWVPSNWLHRQEGTRGPSTGQPALTVTAQPCCSLSCLVGPNCHHVLGP